MLPVHTSGSDMQLSTVAFSCNRLIRNIETVGNKEGVTCDGAQVVGAAFRSLLLCFPE